MERIMKYINRIYRASLIDREEAFREHGLCGGQVSYLRLICSEEGLSQDEIARILFVNKSSVTRQLNQLEKIGFVLRKTDEEDRRANRIYPTDKARALFPKIMEYLDDWNERITIDVGEQNYDDMVQILRTLARSASHAKRGDKE